MEVTEDFFRPQINTTFARITLRQFDHGNSLRPEEKKKRGQPEPDSHAAIGGDGRHDIQIKNGNNKQQNQIRRPRARLSCGADFVRSLPKGSRVAPPSPAAVAGASLPRVTVHDKTRWPEAPCRSRGTQAIRSSALLLLCVPAVLPPALAQHLQTPRGGRQCLSPCAARRSSTAHPTSTAAPSRRG